MRQRLIWVGFALLIALAVVSSFTMAQLTSLSGNVTSDYGQASIWQANVATLSIFSVALLASLAFAWLMRSYFGHYSHLFKNNLWRRAVALVVILAMLIVIGANVNAKLINAIASWITFAIFSYVLYFEVRVLVYLYFSK